MATQIGTCHFQTKRDVLAFYAAYHYDNLQEIVEAKIADGEVCIGAPEVPEGHSLSLNREGRYIINKG